MWGVPWRVVDNAEGCDGYAVVKKDTGKVVHCHPTRARALAQMRALYANEAQTAAAIGALARGLLEGGGDSPEALTAARVFDEAKVKRYPKGTPVSGPAGGGRFMVKENAAGRFEVVNPAGKKVAETNDQAEAQNLAESRTAEATKVGQITAMTDAELTSTSESLSAQERATPVSDTSAWLQIRKEQDLVQHEMTRRAVAGIKPGEEVLSGMNEVDNRGSAIVGTSNVKRLPDGSYEVFERDRSSYSQTYPKFTGTRDEVAQYAQRAFDREKELRSGVGRSQAESSLSPSDFSGRPSLYNAIREVPTDWLVEHGYAEVVPYTPTRSPYGYSMDTGAAANPVSTIRFVPGVTAEQILVHYLGGNPPPANFPVGTEGFDQFMYGHNVPPGATPEEKAAMKRLRGPKKADREAIVRRITAALTAAGFAWDEETLELGIVRDSELRDPALTAAVSIPVAPPESWFSDPGLDRPTPLTVTADGRVYGHLALWDSCHIGEPGGPGVCVAPPRSNTGYTLFHLGEVETAEGNMVATGKITLGTGHASLQASRGAAAAHYDNTGATVADVRAGEDRHGIWVSGALRPGVSPEKVRELRGSQISGDWRRYRNALELVAALAVNVPGFPIPRVAALVAPELEGDDRMALVAAGLRRPLIPEPMSDGEAAARMDALAMLAGIDGGLDFEPEALTAAEFSTKQREKLAKKGQAMSGGSFPIRNRSDLQNAIRALGRAKDPAAAKRWIIKRARELKALDLLPEDWGVKAPS